MSVQEVVRDQTPSPLAPIDESVRVPDAVRAAAQRAESFYGQQQPTDQGGGETPPAPASGETPPAPVEQPAAPAPAAAPAPVETTTPPAPAASEPPVPSKEEIQTDTWASRYNSMKGRYDAAQRTIGDMQEQLSQLSDELIQTQTLLQQMRGGQPTQTPTKTGVKLLTPEDQETYGEGLIDFAKRAAQEAVAPHLSALEEENKNLKKQVAKQVNLGVRQALDRDVPNWQSVYANPRFKEWLRLPDVYSGVPRSKLLSAAVQAADAPRVVAFYRGFILDEAATGHSETTPAPTEQPIAPRAAAVPLETLAAPGRARPATGSTPAPAEKPIFTRAQIAKFYSDVRARVYAGRETEKARLEGEIFAAQREGRVRG